MSEDQSKSGQMAVSREHEKLKVYAKKAALSFELDKLRSRGVGAQKWTVTVEAAIATAPQTYDWNSKIIVQVMERELPDLLAVLMGWCQTWSISGHGTKHDKSLSVGIQTAGNMAFKVTEGARSIIVPIPWDHAYLLIELTLKALRLNSPHMTSDSILHVTKAIARRKECGMLPNDGLKPSHT